MAVIVIRADDERVESAFAPVSRPVERAWVHRKKCVRAGITAAMFRSSYCSLGGSRVLRIRSRKKPSGGESIKVRGESPRKIMVKYEILGDLAFLRGIQHVL